MFFTKIVPYIYDTTDINGIVNIPDIFDNIPNTHSTPTILETAVFLKNIRITSDEQIYSI